MAKKRSSHFLDYVDRTRNEIQPVILVRKLVAHVLGDNPMTPSQVTAALGLIKKILPDITSIELQAMHEMGPETLSKIERVIVNATTNAAIEKVVSEQQAQDEAEQQALMYPTAQDGSWLN